MIQYFTPEYKALGCFLMLSLNIFPKYIPHASQQSGSYTKPLLCPGHPPNSPCSVSAIRKYSHSLSRDLSGYLRYCRYICQHKDMLLLLCCILPFRSNRRQSNRTDRLSLRYSDFYRRQSGYQHPSKSSGSGTSVPYLVWFPAVIRNGYAA